MESAEKMYRAATSKGMHRILIYISLLSAASIPLLFLATIATLSFYHNYLPDQVFSAPVYLQYGVGPHPFGVASLAGANLKTNQAYDIAVVLSVPQSPTNADRGNFMVTIHLLGAELPSATGEQHSAPEPDSLLRQRKILFTSRRPALLPYRDPLVSLASRLLLLGYHLLVPESQALTLEVSMGEEVELASQYAEMPVSAYLEIHAGQALQTYDATIVMTAQLRGLRWLMHQYRLPVFIFATLLFWAAEIFFMVAVWAIWSSRAGTLSDTRSIGLASPEATRDVKAEEEGLDDFSKATAGDMSPYGLRDRPEDELRRREWTPDKEQDRTSSSQGEMDELGNDGRLLRDGFGIGTDRSDMEGIRRRSSRRRLT